MWNIQNDPVLSGNVQIAKCGVLVCSTFVTYCVAYSGSLFQSCGNVWMKMSRTLTWQWPTSDWLNAVTLIKWWSQRCYISCLQKAAQTEICSHLVKWDSWTDAFTPWLLVVTQPHTRADTRAPSNSQTQTRFTLVLRGSVIYLKGCQWALVVTDSDLAQSYAASLKAPHLESNFKGWLHACSFQCRQKVRHRWKNEEGDTR